MFNRGCQAKFYSVCLSVPIWPQSDQNFQCRISGTTVTLACRIKVIKYVHFYSVIAMRSLKAANLIIPDKTQMKIPESQKKFFFKYTAQIITCDFLWIQTIICNPHPTTPTLWSVKRERAAKRDSVSVRGPRDEILVSINWSQYGRNHEIPCRVLAVWPGGITSGMLDYDDRHTICQSGRPLLTTLPWRPDAWDQEK